MSLIDAVIRNFVAAGVSAPLIIVNEQGRECVDRVRARWPGLDARFIVKTTASSLESFVEVTSRLGPGRALVSTVDAWCPPADFVGFVRAAERRPPEATVLAVTPFVADEAPLWVTLDAGGRVTGLGGPEGDMVTAGIYVVPDAVAALASERRWGRLREFLTWLWRRGEPVFGEVISTVVDVDRPEDVVLAERQAAAARPS